MVSSESDPDANDSGYEFEAATSKDIRSGYLTAPGVNRLPVQYGVVDGLALFEGCIELGSVDAVEAEATYIRTAIGGHWKSIASHPPSGKALGSESYKE